MDKDEFHAIQEEVERNDSIEQNNVWKQRKHISRWRIFIS